MEREKVIEIFLGLIFLMLVGLIILLFTNVTSGSKGSTAAATTTISNSYNNYIYKDYPTPTYYQIIDKTSKKYSTKNYNYLRYTSIGNHEKYSGVFGNEINEYKVYIMNKENKGGYFTVKFHLTDYYGKTRTESMTYYVKPHEERKFVYRNVYNDGREYRYWIYEVVSH